MSVIFCEGFECGTMEDWKRETLRKFKGFAHPGFYEIGLLADGRVEIVRTTPEGTEIYIAEPGESHWGFTVNSDGGFILDGEWSNES